MGSFDMGMAKFVEMAVKQIGTWFENGTSFKEAIDETFETNFSDPPKTAKKNEKKGRKSNSKRK